MLKQEKKYDIGDKVVHRKGGVYEAIAYGLHESTLRNVVVYKSLATGQVWVRDQFQFEQEDRFSLLEACNVKD